MPRKARLPKPGTDKPRRGRAPRKVRGCDTVRGGGAAPPVQPVDLPRRIAPMLAQPALEPFDSDRHLFEVKWDGTRCLAYWDGQRLRLLNRRDIEMRPRYPELACLESLPPGTVLDAEIVALAGGKPSFARLQQREHLIDPARIALVAQRIPATLLAFDLLFLAGESLLARPLHERKARLAELVRRLASPHVLASDYIVGAGKQYFAAAERHGLEGIMAKRLDSPYLPGKRSPHWLKIKVARTGEYELIGFVQREGQPVVSAVIIGEPHGRKWHFKGKVGSGFTETQRQRWFAEWQALPPLPNPPADGPRDATWRAIGRRCVVRYFEKTVHGMLRAPVFKGFVPRRRGEAP